MEEAIPQWTESKHTTGHVTGGHITIGGVQLPMKSVEVSMNMRPLLPPDVLPLAMRDLLKPVTLSGTFQASGELQRFADELRASTAHGLSFTLNPELANRFNALIESMKRLFARVIGAIRPAMEALARWWKEMYPHVKQFMPRPKRRPRKRSSRRCAVQDKRKRLGLDTSGRHWAYPYLKRRKILEIAVRSGGFCW